MRVSSASSAPRPVRGVAFGWEPSTTERTLLKVDPERDWGPFRTAELSRFSVPDYLLFFINPYASRRHLGYVLGQRDPISARIQWRQPILAHEVPMFSRRLFERLKRFSPHWAAQFKYQPDVSKRFSAYQFDQFFHRLQVEREASGQPWPKDSSPFQREQELRASGLLDPVYFHRYGSRSFQPDAALLITHPPDQPFLELATARRLKTNELPVFQGRSSSSMLRAWAKPQAKAFIDSLGVSNARLARWLSLLPS